LNAAFTGTQKAVQGTSITFTDHSTGAPTEWNWTFEGGTPSTYAGQTPPPILYDIPGKYDVKLTVANATSAHELAVDDYVEIVQKLAADFTISNDNPDINSPVNFTNTSSGPVSTWAWTFEGANIASSSEPSPQNISYATYGTFDVTLTIGNDLDSHSITKQVSVTDPLVLGVEDNHDDLHVYPTIVSTSFRLEAANPQAVTSVKLMDSFGRIVYEASPSQTEFDLSQKSAGLYILMIQYNGSWSMKKVVKQ